MAKEKKRGFFSWLGFGQKEQTPASETEQTTIHQASPEVSPEPDREVLAPEMTETVKDTDTAPSAHTFAESEHFADAVVNVSEKLATNDKLQSVSDEQSTMLPDVAYHHEDNLLDPVVNTQQSFSETMDNHTVSGEMPALQTHEPSVPSDATVQGEPQPDEWQAEQDLVIEEMIAEIKEDIATNESRTTSEQAGSLASDVDEVENYVQQEQEKPTKEGFFARLKRSLLKTKQNLGSGFISLFRGKKIDDDLFDELEEQLLIADVGVETTRKIITHLTEGASRKQLQDAEALYGLLKDEMRRILHKVDEPLNVERKTPFVILMVGVNGVGKTTTIGKLARQFQQEGKSVMLAAGDTFRAAAVEQLQVWGQRNNIPVIAQHTGADSASVIFDAIQAAKARNIDVLLADTAGRLQNKSHLMEELKKIVRVMKKLDENAPHEVMLTIDASTGQNAISQAQLFNEAIGLTGITLTKLDGTAKGGVIFSVADRFNIPIRYIGVGEQISDLRPFNADDFIEALFARED